MAVVTTGEVLQGALTVSERALVKGRFAVVHPMKAHDRARNFSPGKENGIGYEHATDGGTR